MSNFHAHVHANAVADFGMFSTHLLQEQTVYAL